MSNQDEGLQAIYLKDYTVPSHVVDGLHLTFDLHAEATRVSSRIEMRRNGESGEKDLILNGEELKLLSVKMDGRTLEEGDYALGESTLIIKETPESFVLEIEVENNPKANTALDGLYMSGDLFCTQCEPEGFRRITYFLDRSDVMASFTTKVIGDKKDFPILLSNGNAIGQGGLENGRHWVEWEDPFRKPCYLFALVAGDLGSIRDEFITMSGRKVELVIYCDKGNESRCSFAMESLKKAMRWDEEVYGLEYDLDIFMIVAVDSFNMGAMENKGLNIFNTSCVLADPKTATDADFIRVEAVVAHEYFHNWTGNRVTCRDWFQLTLKEGLTVFRDQEFTSDMHSRPVKRIEDVTDLRTLQFPEDAGPMAHPIKPKSYIEMNNFYTLTIYEKGAEVIRMIHTLIGAEAFRKGIDRYFELYDGQAVTTEDFVNAMEQGSGRDLDQFQQWYHQAGTPDVYFEFDHNEESKEFRLTARQSCKETADGSEKKALHMPIRIGLLNEKGERIPLKHEGLSVRDGEEMLELTKDIESFVFKGIEGKITPSLNRGFSAPVNIHAPYTKKDYLFLMQHDSDPVNRWQAVQQMSENVIMGILAEIEESDDVTEDMDFVNAIGSLMEDESLDYAFRARCLQLPSEDVLAQGQKVIDFDGNHVVREFVTRSLGHHLYERFKNLYHELNVEELYTVDARSIGRRALKNQCLHYMVSIEEDEAVDLAYEQFQNANNMTDEFAALRCLVNSDNEKREEVIQGFYEKWSQEILVMVKWLGVQAGSSQGEVLHRVQGLMQHPVYDATVPNLVRALLLSYVRNHVHFNSNDGQGYRFIADQIMELDEVNPQVASRLCLGFDTYPRLDSLRKKAMTRELERIMAKPGLSSNVYEKVSKCFEMDKELKRV